MCASENTFLKLICSTSRLKSIFFTSKRVLLKDEGATFVSNNTKCLFGEMHCQRLIPHLHYNNRPRLKFEWKNVILLLTLKICFAMKDDSRIKIFQANKKIGNLNELRGT
jgi:hypothetical protein